ncbi:hypothetical protein HPB49_006761 [Dermacentor silvarum]|uniref:Uncharacterized protein n=1 Tax=Dermacentor silvarum TaxID=543639 RepID=A0ACB8DNF3_DERSI|nr:hypothetical protein HPB49_006761 [Dermacentor silvarum]
MASEMEVVTSIRDMASALSIGSFGGRTCIEVHGEDITPQEAEGWSASGMRIKQIMAGKQNGESAAITRQSRPKTRASFAKRVTASVTKAARMPIDMPKEDSKVVMRPRGGLNVAKTEASVIMSVVWMAARVTKEEAKADTICTNAQQNLIVVSTPDERRATLYSKVKALNAGTTPAETPQGIKSARQQLQKGRQQKREKRQSPQTSQSRERGSWADAVKANMAEKTQPPAQNAAKKIQEANGVEKALRDENEKLKRRIAEQDATIKEINEKLTTLIAMHQQQQQPTPAHLRKQEMTENEPEVEVDPRATIAAGPAPKTRAIDGAKERKITGRIESMGDRLDHHEATSKVTNERLTALEQTVQQMTTNIQSTIQNMISQMQTQVQAHIQAQIQSMKAQIIAKLQQSLPGQHVQQKPHRHNHGKKRKESTFQVNVYSNQSHGQQKFKALLQKASREVRQKIGAYWTAPDGTVKGVIRGIAVDDTPEEIAENLLNANAAGSGQELGSHHYIVEVVVPLEGQGNAGIRKHRITDWDAFRKALPVVQLDIRDI